MSQDEAMPNRLQALKQQIEGLSPEEWAELRDWFLELDNEQWNREIERDAANGTLDRLFKK